jgi:rhodanese-related sulfurtransferase
VKILLGKGSPLIGRLLLYDALEMRFQEFKVRRNPRCPMCGESPTIKQLIDYNQFCGVRGEETPSIPSADAPGEIDVTELKHRLDKHEPLFILDVRNPEEYQICCLAGSTLIPLSELPSRYHELDREREIVVHCRSGVRSLKAQHFLQQQGFKRVTNLKGGILAWADRIDRSMPKY